MSGKYSGMPIWAKFLIIISALPVLAYPWMISNAGSEIRTFLLIYPLYVLVSAICAWICWPDRREISWILIVLMLLTHAAMLYLVCKCSGLLL